MTFKPPEIAALALAATMAACLAKEADDPTSAALPNGDLLVGDFEHRDQGRMRAWGWQFEGNAIGTKATPGGSILPRIIDKQVSIGLIDKPELISLKVVGKLW